jgi:ethanolamine permease
LIIHENIIKINKLTVQYFLFSEDIKTISLEQQGLKRTLTPLMLWGLGVGYVISGMYFGWNLGLEKGGTWGLAIATLFIILMYASFTFSYTELACAIPKAGGGFEYANRALGKRWGFIAGIAQIIEFTFAPPAIAFAIGAYFNLFLPNVPVLYISIVSYLIFTALNISGVKAAALFELVITILAVGELLLFAGLTLPHFEMSNLNQNALPNGWQGIFAAIPFAIWFFLGIEGVANVAEETIKPQKTILIGFGSAIITLTILCFLTFFSSIGVGGWEKIVYKLDGSTSDSPLPLALGEIFGNNSGLYHLLITIGLLGLIASFHGLILAAGRATFEFGRVGYFPKVLGKIHPKFKTPANALVFNMVIGIGALLTEKTAEIITISVFGALTLYAISMVAVVRLRKTEPNLNRPFKVPFYPVLPILAFIIAIISIIAMIYYNHLMGGIYIGIIAVSLITFSLFNKKKTT